MNEKRKNFSVKMEGKVTTKQSLNILFLKNLVRRGPFLGNAERNPSNHSVAF